MFCTSCGAQHIDGAKFCAHCGAALQSHTDSLSNAASKPSSAVILHDLGKGTCASGDMGNAKSDVPTDEIRDIGTGQKYVIYAVLVGIAAYIPIIFGILSTTYILQELWLMTYFALLLFSSILGCVGIYRLTRGLGYRTWHRIVDLILICIPFVGTVVLLVLNSKATRRLRSAGYSVGFFGAKRRKQFA